MTPNCSSNEQRTSSCGERALDRGCDRQTVMEVFDVTRRGTIYKEKRSKMYDFPIDAFSRGVGRGVEKCVR